MWIYFCLVYFVINDLIFISFICLMKNIQTLPTPEVWNLCVCYVKPCMLVMYGLCFCFLFLFHFFVSLCLWLYSTMTALFSSITIFCKRSEQVFDHFCFLKSSWTLPHFFLLLLEPCGKNDFVSCQCWTAQYPADQHRDIYKKQF